MVGYWEVWFTSFFMWKAHEGAFRLVEEKDLHRSSTMFKVLHFAE